MKYHYYKKKKRTVGKGYKGRTRERIRTER
jgi:hypothetical protein